jgi:hypothetical protein
MNRLPGVAGTNRFRNHGNVQVFSCAPQHRLDIFHRPGTGPSSRAIGCNPWHSFETIQLLDAVVDFFAGERCCARRHHSGRNHPRQKSQQENPSRVEQKGGHQRPAIEAGLHYRKTTKTGAGFLQWRKMNSLDDYFKRFPPLEISRLRKCAKLRSSCLPPRRKGWAWKDARAHVWPRPEDCQCRPFTLKNHRLIPPMPAVSFIPRRKHLVRFRESVRFASYNTRSMNRVHASYQ